MGENCCPGTSFLVPPLVPLRAPGYFGPQLNWGLRASPWPKMVALNQGPGGGWGRSRKTKEWDSNRQFFRYPKIRKIFLDRTWSGDPKEEVWDSPGRAFPCEWGYAERWRKLVQSSRLWQEEEFVSMVLNTCTHYIHTYIHSYIHTHTHGLFSHLE